jgi:hypothetical protein
MANENRDAASSAAARKPPSYPLNKVGAAVEPSKVAGVLAALEEAGFARDGINVMTAADVPSLDEPIGGAGWRGLLARLNLSLGDQLEEVEDAREELKRGHSLILVSVHDDVEQHRAHDILRQHGGHSMRYFGRWRVAKLADDAHQ